MRLKRFFLTTLLVGSASLARAGELLVHVGALHHQAIRGTTSSDGARASFGALVRLRTESFGEVDVAALSSGTWNEAAILRPFRIWGRMPIEDPLTQSGVRAHTVPRWTLVSSMGVGYFSHTGRTREFDLPVLGSGALITSINQLGYSINERFGLRAIVGLSIATGKSETAFLIGSSFGLSYDF